MPRGVTAATGLDALSQCMEGIVSKSGTPPRRRVGRMKEFGCCGTTSPRALDMPDDLDAREQVMFAALVVGLRDRAEWHHDRAWDGLRVYLSLRKSRMALQMRCCWRRSSSLTAGYLPEKIARIAVALGGEQTAAAAVKDPGEAVAPSSA